MRQLVLLTIIAYKMSLFACLPACLSVCLSVCLYVCLFVHYIEFNGTQTKLVVCCEGNRNVIVVIFHRQMSPLSHTNLPESIVFLFSLERQIDRQIDRDREREKEGKREREEKKKEERERERGGSQLKNGFQILILEELVQSTLQDLS